ncbi:GNAT family N-acetyltransferase [Flaviaesturariibacter amylovorans]|uniref:GNAT family N-acetyltransferase n=1 Tax=Flaviaesturariibacter amylovorans TaxID=1084520 RepID=A0ABP8HUP4_9BACT
MIHYRPATVPDIPGMQVVRRSVTENALSNPDLVRDADYVPFLGTEGTAWIALDGDRIVGFSIADVPGRNIWALFLFPEYEGRGIGKELHRLMMSGYFGQTKETVWLSTAFHTRAEAFYRLRGWTDKGAHNAIERRFEMTAEDWKRISDF